MRRKSKSERKIFVKTTTRNKIRYVKAKPKKRTCTGCGALLIGIKRDSSFSLKKMVKSKKRVSRKFGGELCSKCSRERIIEEVKEWK